MKAPQKRKTRSERGNLYVLYIALAAMLIVGWNMFAGVGVSLLVNYRNKCALEAASLAAARDLSRIVIDDAKWGYVSLTDQPPIGSETVAIDGYPLPVTGINTILASVRLELIVAHSIGSNEAIDCAMSDLESARQTSRHLSRVLRNSLKENKNSPKDEIAHDIFGKEVTPMKSARELYKTNAASLLSCLGWNVETVTGELGFLESDGITNTSLPGQGQLACLDSSLQDSTVYPAFVDVPAFEESFYFAGLGKQVSLVEPHLFQSYSTQNNCSIIKLTSQLKKRGENIYMKSAACAQPAYMEDKMPTAYMVLRFPNGVPSKASTLRELLTSEGMNKEIPLCTARGGDFPTDRGAVLQPNPDKPVATVKQAFTRAFFDWLRTAHAKPKLESIISALDYQFSKVRSSETYLFTINNQGTVNVDAPQNYPFPSQTTYENQLYTVAFNAILDSGMSWTVRIRDQVHRLGNREGGKHAGQPMPSVQAVDMTQEEEKRLLEKAGSRYDRSRLATEVEISSPIVLSAVDN
jgi:hypothetical protein